MTNIKKQMKEIRKLKKAWKRSVSSYEKEAKLALTCGEEHEFNYVWPCLSTRRVADNQDSNEQGDPKNYNSDSLQRKKQNNQDPLLCEVRLLGFGDKSLNRETGQRAYRQKERDCIVVELSNQQGLSLYLQVKLNNRFLDQNVSWIESFLPQNIRLHSEFPSAKNDLEPSGHVSAFSECCDTFLTDCKYPEGKFDPLHCYLAQEIQKQKNSMKKRKTRQ